MRQLRTWMIWSDRATTTAAAVDHYFLPLMTSASRAVLCGAAKDLYQSSTRRMHQGQRKQPNEQANKPTTKQFTKRTHKQPINQVTNLKAKNLAAMADIPSRNATAYRKISAL